MEEIPNYESPFKGRIGEAIVEALFIGSGIRIHRTGYEWIRPLLPTRVNNRPKYSSQVKNNFQGMPDFYLLLATEEKPGKLESEFLEVKFCRDGKLDWDEITYLRSFNPWQPTLVIIQQEPRPCGEDSGRMRVYHHPYKMSGSHIDRSESVLEQTRWKINADVYASCEKMINLYFEIDKNIFPKKKE